MCWRCHPGGPGNHPDEVEAAVQTAARTVLSRRMLLRAGWASWPLPGAHLLQSCTTVPVTGRSQLRLISEADEAQLGIQAFQQLRQQEQKKGRYLSEPEAPAEHAWVKRVADRIISASGLGCTYQWQFMLINEPKTINAAAIAGGRIIVYTGILPVARDDAGLATILGHETAHVMAHHTAERASQDELVNLAGAVAGAAGVSSLTLLPEPQPAPAPHPVIGRSSRIKKAHPLWRPGPAPQPGRLSSCGRS